MILAHQCTKVLTAPKHDVCQKLTYTCHYESKTLTEQILYIFGYKTEFFFRNNAKNLDPYFKMDLDLYNFFPFQNNPKNLDLSYKTDLDL